MSGRPAGARNKTLLTFDRIVGPVKTNRPNGRVCYSVTAFLGDEVVKKTYHRSEYEAQLAIETMQLGEQMRKQGPRASGGAHLRLEAWLKLLWEGCNDPGCMPEVMQARATTFRAVQPTLVLLGGIKTSKDRPDYSKLSGEELIGKIKDQLSVFGLSVVDAPKAADDSQS